MERLEEEKLPYEPGAKDDEGLELKRGEWGGGDGEKTRL